jgi:hypothetical protein
VDKESSLLWLSAGYVCPELLWLSAGYVCPETEDFAVAIHDGVIKNRNYQKHCLRVEVIDKCRKYGTVSETIEH